MRIKGERDRARTKTTLEVSLSRTEKNKINKEERETKICLFYLLHFFFQKFFLDMTFKIFKSKTPTLFVSLSLSLSLFSKNVFLNFFFSRHLHIT